VIYFIGTERRGSPIKVGITSPSALEGRLASLQCGNAERLYVLNTYRAPNAYPARTVERAIHLAFGHARLVGEWFDPWRDVRVEHLAVAPTASVADRVWATVFDQESMWPRRAGGYGLERSTRVAVSARHLQGLYPDDARPAEFGTRRFASPLAA
jgi:hypothetical protein